MKDTGQEPLSAAAFGVSEDRLRLEARPQQQNLPEPQRKAWSWGDAGPWWPGPVLPQAEADYVTSQHSSKINVLGF